MIDSSALAIISKNSILDAFPSGDIKVSLNPSRSIAPQATPVEINTLPFADIVEQVEAKPEFRTLQATTGTGLSGQSPATETSFYLDQQSLSTLKYDNSQQGLMAAAQQFEALFIQSMLKRMRAASEALSNEDNPLSTKSSSLFQGMLDAQLAQNISRQSQFGLADMIYKQLASQVPTDSADAVYSLSKSNHQQGQAEMHDSAALHTVINHGGVR